MIRAFVNTIGSTSGRREGGSTITQQLAKNLLVGDELSYQRKIREIIVASRIEHLLSKDEILELYLNTIYFGRSSWGIRKVPRCERETADQANRARCGGNTTGRILVMAGRFSYTLSQLNRVTQARR